MDRINSVSSFVTNILSDPERSFPPTIPEHSGPSDLSPRSQYKITALKRYLQTLIGKSRDLEAKVNDITQTRLEHESLLARLEFA